MRPDAIELQKNLIQKFHEKGAEVLLSTHAMVELSCEQTVSLALEMQSRGADIVKIVADCKSLDQQIKVLETNLELKKHLNVPFLYICIGSYSRYIRMSVPLFGSMLVFGHHKYGELSNKLKPLISDLKEFYRLVPYIK